MKRDYVKPTVEIIDFNLMGNIMANDTTGDIGGGGLSGFEGGFEAD